jgi:hypothetical protein
MPFFKAYSEGILRGSLAYANETTQLIWIKLLAIANETRERDGYLRYSEGHPYSKDYIAEMCHVPISKLNKALDEFFKDTRNNIPRIVIANDGSFKLSNFIKYQAKPERKPREPISEAQKDGLTLQRMGLKNELIVQGATINGMQVTSKKTGEVLN